MKILFSVVLTSALLSACYLQRSAPAVSCLQEQLPSSRSYDPIRNARLIVTDQNFRRNLSLPTVDTSHVQFETDPRVCAKISRALGRTRASFDSASATQPTYVDVIVVRLGTAGYYVQSMWHSTSAGEFPCHQFVFDANIKRKETLCG